MYSHAATILPVNKIRTSIDFYTQKLGFDCSFEWEDPPTYAVLNYKERISIHLSLSDTIIENNQNHAALSIFVYDVDKVYADLLSKKVPIHNPIGTRDYGMRDFDILDPNGYVITFGMYVGDKK